MGKFPHTRINLPDRSYQAIARSEIRKIALEAGFTSHRLGEIEIIAAELTSNLLQHSPRGGYLLIKNLERNLKGIEIISIDSGPGIRFPKKMMEDGTSTKKTLGQGLGAINRLTNVFDIYSIVDWGTIVYTRTYVEKEYVEDQDDFQFGLINVCYPGLKVCGDRAEIIRGKGKIHLILMDGLGHGPKAFAASDAGAVSFQETIGQTPTQQLRKMHESLRGTRGAVATVVCMDLANKQLAYSGVGNISMKIISPAIIKGCFAYNGIVGHILPSSLNVHYSQFNQNDLLVMHSDGITSRWDIHKYPKIARHHPIMLCAALYKDHDRGNDDSSVLVAKMFV